MLDIGFILYIWFAHWVADFVLQSHNMATQKSSSNYWLSMHVATYTVVMAFFAWWAIPYISYNTVFAWTLSNGFLHWLTDYCTSRWSKKFFSVQDYHNGFVIVGLDQFIHLACLLTTMNWILHAH
jgi:hypothetical protein